MTTGEKSSLKLLSGGNPQIPKGYGDGPVQAYIAAMPGWKRSVGERIDAAITKELPTVAKAVKWNSPFYGVEKDRWFLNVHCFTHYVKVTFFQGSSLNPMPQETSKYEAVRAMNIHEGDDFEVQLAHWVRQAKDLPGEKM